MKNIELLLVVLFCLYGCGQPKPQKSSLEVHIPVPEMYQKPFKYIGMDVKEASQLFAVQENVEGTWYSILLNSIICLRQMKGKLATSTSAF